MGFILRFAIKAVLKLVVGVFKSLAQAGQGAAGSGRRGNPLGLHLKIRRWDQFDKVKREANAAVEAALDAAAETAVRSAKRRAPRETGELRDSITRTAVQSTSRGYEVIVLADAPHARWVEYGTVRTAAQPFIRPAARSGRTKFRRELRAEMKRRLPGS